MDKRTKFLISAELVVIIASLCGNVYQYNSARQLEQQIADSNTAIENLQANNADLEKQIADATAELESLKNDISALNTQLDESIAERDALQSELSDLQAKAEQRQKEEEEAAKKAAEEVAKNTTTSKASTVTATKVTENYEPTEADKAAAIANIEAQLGVKVTYVENGGVGVDPIAMGVETGHQVQ